MANKEEKSKKSESSEVIYKGMTREELEVKVTNLYIDNNFAEEAEDWYYHFDIFSLVLDGYRGYSDYSDEELIKDYQKYKK